MIYDCLVAIVTFLDHWKDSYIMRHSLTFHVYAKYYSFFLSGVISLVDHWSDLPCLSLVSFSMHVIDCSNVQVIHRYLYNHPLIIEGIRTVSRM